MPSCCVEGISAHDWAGFSCEPRGGGLVGVSGGNKDMHDVTVCIHTVTCQTTRTKVYMYMLYIYIHTHTHQLTRALNEGSHSLKVAFQLHHIILNHLQILQSGRAVAAVLSQAQSKERTQ